MKDVEGYTIDELQAMRDNCNDVSDWKVLDGILSTRKADAYAHEANDQAYPDSTGTVT